MEFWELLEPVRTKTIIEKGNKIDVEELIPVPNETTAEEEKDTIWHLKQAFFFPAF